MKQLIILLFIPVMASAQVKTKPAKADSVGKWTTREPDYKPSIHREGTLISPVRTAMQSTTWYGGPLDSTKAVMEYRIMINDCIYFQSSLIRDTLYIEPSLFDSSTVKAKWIKVAGKIFELKK